jgi:uncharacterized protein HemX
MRNRILIVLVCALAAGAVIAGFVIQHNQITAANATIANQSREITCLESATSQPSDTTGTLKRNQAALGVSERQNASALTQLSQQMGNLTVPSDPLASYNQI